MLALVITILFWRPATAQEINKSINRFLINIMVNGQ
ncbi:hypothetical protein M2408_001907 [Sphingobacterium sp. BIGb0165]|nr:hypothetical protein [Sphingobacterium sp. BIGb0165]